MTRPVPPVPRFFSGPRAEPAATQPPHSQRMVGVAGFEPATPSSRTRCATRLRYTPAGWSDVYRRPGKRPQQSLPSSKRPPGGNLTSARKRRRHQIIRNRRLCHNEGSPQHENHNCSIPRDSRARGQRACGADFDPALRGHRHGRHLRRLGRASEQGRWLANPRQQEGLYSSVSDARKVLGSRCKSVNDHIRPRRAPCGLPDQDRPSPSLAAIAPARRCC